MQVLKSNADVINEYFDAMQTEINPSNNYKKINRNTLTMLSRFHINKAFTKMKREDILSYLNSHRKSDEMDPLHKCLRFRRPFTLERSADLLVYSRIVTRSHNINNGEVVRLKR